ncbi:MAG TPA: hypothetical protein VF950_26925 [Planctomycetota bacterium]
MNRPLLRASIWSTLTLGAAFGAFNLLVVHARLAANPPSHNQSHAGFQIWGFVFLFVLASGDVRSRFALWGTLAAQALITWGRVDVLPGALAALALGSLLQLVVTVSVRASFTWIVSAALLVAGAIEALIEGDVNASIRWAHAMYAVALFGAAFPWLHPLKAGRWLSRLGGVVMAVGAIARSTEAADVGLLLVAVSGALYGRPMGLLFAAVASGYAMANLAVGASSLILDAARHAFTLGVLTLAIFERAGARSPWGVRLIVAGTLLRQAQVVAAFFPAWLYVSAFSGFIAAAGVVLAGAATLRTPRSEPPPR